MVRVQPLQRFIVCHRVEDHVHDPEPLHKQAQAAQVHKDESTVLIHWPVLVDDSHTLRNVSARKGQPGRSLSRVLDVVDIVEQFASNNIVRSGVLNVELINYLLSAEAWNTVRTPSMGSGMAPSGSRRSSSSMRSVKSSCHWQTRPLGTTLRTPPLTASTGEPDSIGSGLPYGNTSTSCFNKRRQVHARPEHR